MHRNTVGKLAKRSTFCDNKVHDSLSEWPRVLRGRSAAAGVWDCGFEFRWGMDPSVL